MFYYNRQIVYMDLWKGGERVRNAGFLKLEETDRGLRWQMRIRGLGEADTGFFDLRDETGALVDKILLQKGEGSYERAMEPGAMTRGGRAFREICGLRAELSGGRYLKGSWKLSGRGKELAEAPAPETAVPETAPRKADVPEEIPPKEFPAESPCLREVPPQMTPQKMASEEKKNPASERICCPKGRCLQAAGGRGFAPAEVRTSPQTADSPASAAGPRMSAQTEDSPAPAGPRTLSRGADPRMSPSGTGPGMSSSGTGSRMSSSGTDPRTSPADTREAVREGDMRAREGEDKGVASRMFYEDKWEQLQHMYPQVHPFGDERAFLSITPGDFVILGREYQKLVHNSFLLHGYYNYRHVILGRYPDEEGENYYLGVPGVYYEREKMAAEMFGFEAFEGKREPAQQGDFGYYMKRIRI